MGEVASRLFPVAMDFDAHGRLWVTEGIDYNQGLRVQAGRSIMVVEDKDGDGKADHSHPFVTEKEMRHAPLGIAVFDNRIVLSATPSIIVYTDVDRNTVFDPKVDKREVFLTGFQNKNHDHTVHAVVGAPSGQWHFPSGIAGPISKPRTAGTSLPVVITDTPRRSERKARTGKFTWGHDHADQPGRNGPDSDGGEYAQPHDMFVTSHGDFLQSDNDDPAHSRSSWVMEHANMGYADLTDGSRSWEEVAKTWEEPSGWNKSLRFSRSHWRKTIRGPSLRGRSTAPVRLPETYSSRVTPSGWRALTWFAVWYARRSWRALPNWWKLKSRWERIVPSLRSRPRKRVSVFSPPALLLLRTDLFSSAIFTTIPAGGPIR